MELALGEKTMNDALEARTRLSPEYRSILDAARDIPPPRSCDIIILPTVAPFYLRCPNCSFMSDRARFECLACGVIFAKWKPRVLPIPASDHGWAGWIGAIWDLAARRPRWSLAFSLAMGVLWMANGPKPLHSPVASIALGEWKSAGFLRYRVSYLKPEGFFGGLGVYHGGDDVGYIVEATNLGDKPISGLRIASVQEVPGSGSRPAQVLSKKRLLGWPLLRHGESVTLRGEFTVAGFNRTGSHTEYTHLTFEQMGPAGEFVTFADVPKAGAIDP